MDPRIRSGNDSEIAWEKSVACRQTCRPKGFSILTVDLDAGEHFCVNISCHAFLRDGDSIKHCFHWTFAFAVFIGIFHWVRISQALWSNGQVTY